MTMVGLPVWTFGALLVVLWMMSVVTEGRFMLRTTLALLANWAAHLGHYALFADPTPYQFSIFADVLTAVVILSRPAARMQSVIGTTLLIQIGVSFGYWWHIIVDGYNLSAEVSYWSWLDGIALAQIVLVGGWGIDGMARHIFGDSYRHLVPWYRALPDAPHRPGVAQS